MKLIEVAYEIANKDRRAELMTSMHRPSYYDGLLQGALEMAKCCSCHLAISKAPCNNPS